MKWVFFYCSWQCRFAHYCHVWRTLIARSPSLSRNPYPDLSDSSAGSFAASACRRLSYIVKRFIVVGSWRQFVAPPVAASATTSTSTSTFTIPTINSISIAISVSVSGCSCCCCCWLWFKVYVPAARRRSLDDNCYAYRMLCEYEFGQWCCQMGGWWVGQPGQIAVDCQARTVGDPRCQLP